jgi:ParB-like chromosome segregation protein Spo0J
MSNHDSRIMELPCELIFHGDRHRKDLGDLQALAESIEKEGLLQPIGVTPEYELVFGERRLSAVRDVLKREMIEVRIVDLPNIVVGEFVENELRKDFSPSERVEICKSVEAELGNRRGLRTDLELSRNGGDVTTGRSSLEPSRNGGEVASNPLDQEPSRICGGVRGRTIDIAAEKAGFGSAETYERAKSVVDSGTPELVRAMDSGQISIHAASVIATQPPARQAEIINKPKQIRRKIVREIREAAELPTTTEARRLARETGNLVADRTGRYRSGASDEERAATKADLDAIWAVTRGVLAIADTTLDPEELAARLEYWHCPEIRGKTPAALAWLTRFQKGVENNDQIS